MNKDLYVLGAGFGRDFNPKTFPLMSDFLSLARRNGHYNPDQTHQVLASFMNRYFGSPEYGDIEKIMSFLALPALDDRFVPYENRSFLYDLLVRMITNSLSRAHFASSDENTRTVYEGFAKHLVETDSVVISFNYDLLLEKLLYEAGAWCGYDGYGADIPPISTASPLPGRRKGLNYSSYKESKVIILKPHGSISWGIPTWQDFEKAIICQDDLLYAPGRDFMDLMHVQAVEDKTVLSISAPFTEYYRSVIIPPVLDKVGWYEKAAIRVIWNMAKEAVRNAENIFFIGYSMPPTDFTAEFLFRQAIAWSSVDSWPIFGPPSDERPKQKRVLVVNPKAAELKDRYAELFGKDITLVAKSFKDWFYSENYGNCK